MSLKLVRHLSEFLLDQLADTLSGVDVPFVLANGDIKAGQLNDPITLYLTFVVSPNTASSQVLPIDATNLQSTEANTLTLGEATVADPRTDMASAENALQIANEAMTTIKLSDTWKVTLERIKWVMDTVSPVAEVHPNIPFFCQSLSKLMSSLVEPVCKNGIWSAFCDPQGESDSFTPSSA